MSLKTDKKPTLNPPERLKPARLLMIISSFSPLFVLWAIKGNTLFQGHLDYLFIAACLALAILPSFVLWLRIYIAKKEEDTREIIVGRASDSSDHILVYLFTMFLPLYLTNIVSVRDLFALLVALAFIIFLFFHLKLHYMNLIFACFGYRVFTIYPPEPNDKNPLHGRIPQVLITPRNHLVQSDRIISYRISNSVYIEMPR